MSDFPCPIYTSLTQAHALRDMLHKHRYNMTKELDEILAKVENSIQTFTDNLKHVKEEKERRDAVES